MTAVSSRHTKVAAIFQFTGVVLCLPPLILPDFLPGWSVTAALVGIAILPLLGLVMARRPFARTPVDLPLGLFLGLSVVNLLTSIDRAATFPQVTKTIAGIALFYGLVGLLLETGWLRLATWGVSLLGLGLVPLVLLGVQWSGAKFSWLPWAPGEIIPHLFRPFWKPSDYAGFNANMAGGVLAMVLPVPLALTVIRQGDHSARSWVSRIVAGLITLAVAATLLLTQSRGAILAVLVAIVVMASATNWRWLVAIILLLAVGAIALQTMDLTIPATWDLVSDTESVLNSAAGRAELWSRAWAMLQDFPYTGIGMGLVREVVPLKYPSFRIPSASQLDHAHNLYLNTGAEMGYPGLIALLALLLNLVVLGWHATRRAAAAAPQAAPLAVGTLGSLVVVCIHGFTDTVTFYAKAHLVAWALFGVLVGVGLRCLRGAREK